MLCKLPLAAIALGPVVRRSGTGMPGSSASQANGASPVGSMGGCSWGWCSSRGLKLHQAAVAASPARPCCCPTLSYVVLLQFCYCPTMIHGVSSPWSLGGTGSEGPVDSDAVFSMLRARDVRGVPWVLVRIPGSIADHHWDDHGGSMGTSTFRRTLSSLLVANGWSFTILVVQ